MADAADNKAGLKIIHRVMIDSQLFKFMLE